MRQPDMTRFKLTQRIGQITDALQRALLAVLCAHVGQENAIARSTLLQRVQEHRDGAPDARRCSRAFLKLSDRKLRKTIENLREKGIPVCSGNAGSTGYYMAIDGTELRRFLERELDTRIRSLASTRRKMFAGGLAIFGPQAELDYETRSAACDAGYREGMVAGDDRARRRKVEA